MFTTTRNRLMLLVAGLTVLMLSSLSQAQAQEGSFEVNDPSYGVPEEYEIEEVPNPEEVLINSEKDFQAEKSPAKKKKAVPAIKKDTVKSSSGAQSNYTNNTKDAESVLSFNFLYYIIQRFKFTEVVDQ